MANSMIPPLIFVGVLIFLAGFVFFYIKLAVPGL
ncbi:MAG: hypothetical protein AB203_00820 [Parcubacteria bacterium C7867-008]|nr:MAG: hypothetical protein AB203_00820 [Parcubacteria bacterium C7867-008]